MRSANVVDIGAPRNGWKLIVLDIFAVMFAGAFGYFFSRYLAGGFSFWFAFGALLLWGALSVLGGFLEKDISHRFLVLFLESVALIAFFYTYAWQALAIAFILVFPCLLWGYFSVRRELRNTIEVRFFIASGKVVGKVITATVVFMVVMFASLANMNGNFFISQSSFNIIFGWSAGFVNNFYPNLKFDGTFGDFAQDVALMQVKNDPAFGALMPDEQSAVLTQSAGQIASAFSSAPVTIPAAPANASSTAPASFVALTAPVTPAISATLAEPTNNVFYTYLAALTAKLQDKFGTAFIGIWALGLFLILRSIGIIVVWIAQFVSLIFYELLLALGFMKISEQPATKEIIEL